MAHPRNPETSYCEVRKVSYDQNGSKIVTVVGRVRGRANAEALADSFDRRLTEEEKKARTTHYWEYTSRRLGRDWQIQHRPARASGRPNRRKHR